MSENTFKASNGIVVTISDDGYLTGKGGNEESVLHATGGADYGVQALREYFQWERDTELGRVRWPENPNVVIYRDPGSDDSAGRCIKVFREDTAAFTYFWEKHRSHPDPVREAATTWYFTEGPGKEPERPWEEAAVGEVWRLTVNGEEQNALADQDPGEAWFSTCDSYISAANPDITAGRKLVNADGTPAE